MNAGTAKRVSNFGRNPVVTWIDSGGYAPQSSLPGLQGDCDLLRGSESK